MSQLNEVPIDPRHEREDWKCPYCAGATFYLWSGAQVQCANARCGRLSDRYPPASASRAHPA